MPAESSRESERDAEPRLSLGSLMKESLRSESRAVIVLAMPKDDPGPQDEDAQERAAWLPLGVIVRRQPGATRWQKWIWRPVAVVPGAGPAEWHEMRRDGEAIEYHAGTVMREVHRTMVDGYRAALSNEPPVVYVILRAWPRRPEAPNLLPLAVHAVTANAYEAEAHLDSGEDIVEPVPMPPQLIAWLAGFVDRHNREEVFIKRTRQNWSEPSKNDEGRGDPRIAEGQDVFRAPTAGRQKGRGTLH